MMLKKFFVSILTTGVLLAYAINALSEIVVEDANSTWDQSISTFSSPVILPRITVEYNTTYTDISFILPIDLLLSAATAEARIVVEYATTMPFNNLAAPPCKGDFDGDGDVDSLDLLAYADNLEKMALIIFGFSFGRNNCLD